ncbi:MAG TPA: recombinase family protein [Methylomirabilota bacterium]|nr:recombinase family protein [Methylomirabilota bacterium]
MQHTTQDLTNFLKTLHNAEEEKDDITNVKYIIYSRKSTESSERQIRSLADQVTECKSVASSKNLQLYSAKPITESESAKEPDIRPKFRQMINEIKGGKYGGIIAWHPDRLARNMKEAGEIIDLIDKGIIKDLQFVSFTFQNNTAGKMLLGITFVLSKQYSDQLSDNVLRGIRRSIEEGKYLSKAKHGYYKDVTQYLRPDGDNYTLIKEAWKMRLDGKMQEEIADYLNQNQYSKPTDTTGENHEPFVFSHKRISELFKDSTYCGVLVYGEKEKKIVDLTEVYDFVPMISVDEFLKINKFSSLDTFKQRFKVDKEGTVKADLLRGKVICGYCNHSMTSGLTPKMNRNKGLTHYYNYRCAEKGCRSRIKAVRAHVVVNYGIDYLRKHKFDSREVYEHYVYEMRRVIASQEELLETQRRSLTSAKVDTDDKIVKIKDLLLQETDIQVKNVFKVDLKKEQANVAKLTKDIEKVKEEKAKHKQAILSYEQFLELFNDLPNIISKTKTLSEKDFLLGKIFLNFIVKNKKVLSCQLNQPFDKFKKRGKTEKILSGADERS